NIPSEYRHPKGYWFGLTTRARIVYASKKRVKRGALKNYEDLADSKWKGKICIRSGKHAYNLSLFASIINAHGSATAEKWLRGLHSNLARKPQGNDRAQVKGIYSGLCDLAIGNTYYMGKMQTNKKKPAHKKWAKSVYLIFPNQGNRGTHVNISGAAVTRGAKNKHNAIKLIKFLSEKFAQEMYAHQNFEYPVKSGIKIHPLVKSWGSFSSDNVKLSKIAGLRSAASKLVDKVNFNK
ncbi:MAG: extracellular solute-binding protein, partial [Nitrospinota bacterium]|nr:extracellular solute-binding protein [Nitrospinota bacterium]